MTEIKTRRWMQTVLAEAKDCTVQMPWARGARREEMLARRKVQATNLLQSRDLRSA
jgi:hypothetical protein